MSTTRGTDSFTIPLIAVNEMGKYIFGMYNKRSSGPGEISNQLLKLASPYIAWSLTYLFNLCIEQNASKQTAYNSRYFFVEEMHYRRK